MCVENLKSLKYVCLLDKIPVEDARSDLAVNLLRRFNGSPLLSIKIDLLQKSFVVG